MSRLGVYGLSIGVAVAMLSPILRCPPVDSFPLSTYPMFSDPRTPISNIHTVLGVAESGQHKVLTPELITGDHWVILAVATLRKARKGGPKTQRAMCESVAKRVAADEEWADRITEVTFVTEVYDAPAYFSGETTPRSVQVHATCPVPVR